jgi:hypothetical protein
MTADDGVGQVKIFDHCLQPAPIILGHLAAEDGGDFVGLSDGAISVEQALAESIQSRTPMEDEIVAIFGLRKRTGDAGSRLACVPSR